MEINKQEVTIVMKTISKGIDVVNTELDAYIAMLEEELGKKK